MLSAQPRALAPIRKDDRRACWRVKHNRAVVRAPWRFFPQAKGCSHLAVSLTRVGEGKGLALRQPRQPSGC
eukprot:scaffold95504_cov34-Tisochrysis_lutea.AAC.4